MNNSRRAGRKLLGGFLLSLAVCAPAFAATYQVGLFEGGTGTGSGSFTFTNPGTVGSTPATVTLSTNASSSIGARTFTAGDLNVQVAAVNFNDGKTGAQYGANQITGNYVEGLTGSLRTPDANNLATTGQCNNQACYYRITFSFSANANPNAASKTYTIDLIRASNGNIQSTVNGTYSVSNTATIPEPGSLALLGSGLAAMVWGARRRRSLGATV